MPTITRFLGFLILLATIATAVVLALAFLVTPEPRTYTIPIDQSVILQARPLTPPAPPVSVEATGAVSANSSGDTP